MFFFNDTATTEIYTLSLHDALPISDGRPLFPEAELVLHQAELAFWHDDAAMARAEEASRERNFLAGRAQVAPYRDRKSTRLNSSHANISYAVFCLKKKKKKPDEMLF